MIKISGFALLSMPLTTVNDLREAVRWMDRHHISGDRLVDVEYALKDRVPTLFLVLADTDDGHEGYMVECGDHYYDDPAFNVMFDTHTHDDEHVEDPVPDVQPGWDWVRRLILPDGDRYGDQTRPE